MTRSIFLACLVAVLGSGCGVYGLKTNTSGQAERASEVAPEFALPDSDDAIVTLADLLADDKPAVLVFYRGHW